MNNNEENLFQNENNNEENKQQPIELEKEEIIEQHIETKEEAREQSIETNTAEKIERSTYIEEKKRESKRLSPIVAGFLGAIIGSSTMLGGLMFMDDKVGFGGSSQSNRGQNVSVTVNNVSQDDVTAVIQQAKKSVVGVVNYQSSTEDVLGNLLGEGSGNVSREPREAGSGSGIIYKKENGKAYIVTNHHVIEGAQRLSVTLDDGTSLEARLVGSDQWMDLAVLEVDGSKVQDVAKLGNSDHLIAGQSVIAIGNPLGFLKGTVTQGIVSSTERLIPVDINSDGVSDWEAQVIQTDAAINPGNSGGALLSANGEVIGINSSKIASASVEGIGFAIPINAAMPILEQLKEHGSVQRPQMGVQLVPLSQVPVQNRAEFLRLPESVTNGLVVVSATTGSPAARAGLKKYDVITEINGRAMTSMLDVRKYLFEEANVGDTITITYYRDGNKATTSLTLEAMQNQ